MGISNVLVRFQVFHCSLDILGNLALVQSMGLPVSLQMILMILVSCLKPMIVTKKPKEAWNMRNHTNYHFGRTMADWWLYHMILIHMCVYI